GCSGIAVCDGFRIGMDLEPIASKALRLREKFLNDTEKKILNTSDALEMTLAWSCKEALYKLAGRKKIIFKTELLLLERTAANWRGQIINPDGCIDVELTTIVTPDMVVTLNTKPCEYKPHS